jgi:hypothetical protein
MGDYEGSRRERLKQNVCGCGVGCLVVKMGYNSRLI